MCPVKDPFKAVIRISTLLLAALAFGDLFVAAAMETALVFNVVDYGAQRDG
jgi:hypothetical protein